MSYDYFKDSNEIAQRLVNNIGDQIEQMRSLAEESDTILADNMSEFANTETDIQDNKQT